MHNSKYMDWIHRMEGKIGFFIHFPVRVFGFFLMYFLPIGIGFFGCLGRKKDINNVNIYVYVFVLHTGTQPDWVHVR